MISCISFYFTFPLVDVDYGTFSFVVCYLFPTSVSSPRRAKPGFNNGSYESFNILPHSKVFVVPNTTITYVL
jgi:hypothetical protein